MNKVLVLTLMLIFSTISSAQVRRWFNQPMNCCISGNGASCQVTNFRHRPIYCEAQASARTYYGYFLNGFFRGWVQPRQSAYIYIRANNSYRDPVIAANARARCLF
jgi:hypothetical protein